MVWKPWESHFCYCVKCVRIRSYFGPHFCCIWTEYGKIRSNAGKCGKNADQNNSEYGHFLRSVQIIQIYFLSTKIWKSYSQTVNKELSKVHQRLMSDKLWLWLLIPDKRFSFSQAKSNLPSSATSTIFENKWLFLCKRVNKIFKYTFKWMFVVE